MIALTQIIMNAQRVEYDLRMARKRLEGRPGRTQTDGGGPTTERNDPAQHLCRGPRRHLHRKRNAPFRSSTRHGTRLPVIPRRTGSSAASPACSTKAKKSSNGLDGRFLTAYGNTEQPRCGPRHVRKDGSLCDVILTAALLQPDNPSAGTVITLEDITDRLKSEEESRKLQAQFHQAQKMESVGRPGRRHRPRLQTNMLGVILGHTELAMFSTDGKPPLHNNLLEIRKAAERSADLTRQLLAFARRQTIAPKVLDLNTMVEGMPQDAQTAHRRGYRPFLGSRGEPVGRQDRPRPDRSG